MANRKKCFVVMGFGEKVDLATGRTLDLDKTYRIIIKKAVEEAGLECIRADDVIHAGLIDAPMYELLLDADVVIADLSTANANAIYELGVRHALRPHTTIVLAEKQFKFPFDLSHVVIRLYEHLGKGIDAEEAERVRTELKKAIETLVGKPDVDSPVYRFLPRLQAWNAGVAPIVAAAREAEQAAAPQAAPPPPPPMAGAAPPPAAPQPAAAAPLDEAAKDPGTTSELMDLFKQAKNDSQWKFAAQCLTRLRARRPNDDYVKQQLALATYKSKEPDVITALRAAQAILQELKPATSTDPETLGLWGAVHKRLFEETKDPAHLDVAVSAYEKGFYLKNDYYNGINLAFVLNQRASISTPREALADVVLAERIRRRVIAICEGLLQSKVKDDEGNVDQVETFWVNASLVEALTGSGQAEKATELRAAIARTVPQKWMLDSLDEQLGKLKVLLAAAPAFHG